MEVFVPLVSCLSLIVCHCEWSQWVRRRHSYMIYACKCGRLFYRHVRLVV